MSIEPFSKERGLKDLGSVHESEDWSKDPKQSQMHLQVRIDLGAGHKQHCFIEQVLSLAEGREEN
jgi:hypothetical protein